jgi:biopolymer transport protein ExbD
MALPRIQLFEEETSDEPLVNLTPLIDVVFVVLITFMLIAPVLELDRVQLADGSSLPKEQSSPLGKEALSITVQADNVIWVEGRPIALSDLGSWLKSQKARHPLAIPKLIQDSRASFGTYQTIKNKVEACGFEEMDVLLQPGK